MNDGRSGSGPHAADGSWATEALPLSVRKELLERELRRLGFRKAPPAASASGGDSPGDGGAGDRSHPQAGDTTDSHGG